MKKKTYMVDPKVALSKLVCRYRIQEQTYYVVEKSKLELAMKDFSAPVPVGFPVPSARVKDWPIYVAQYDPFDWTESRMPPKEYYAMKERQRQRINSAKRRARKRAEKAKQAEQAKQEA